MANIDTEKEAMDAVVLMSEIINQKKRHSKTGNYDEFFPSYGSNLKQVLAPIESVESSYGGLHLGDTYEETEFLKLVEYFHNGQMIHIKYALKIVEDALNKFKNYSNIVYCNSSKMSAKLGFLVVGDLHGSFKDLRYIINNFGIPGKQYRVIFLISYRYYLLNI